MSSVYEAWKPLRNYLSKVDIHDALGVIRYYSVRRDLKEKPPVPSDMELHPWADRDVAFLPWELETLAREAIFICQPIKRAENTLKTIRGISFAINKLKNIDEYISKSYIGQKNILQEVTVRLAHRQFKYQTERPNWNSIIRYGEIYSHKKLSELVFDTFGISTKQLYTIGIGVWGLFTSQYGLRYPLRSLHIKDVDADDYDKFMELFSCDMDKMKGFLAGERYYDDEFFYSYHSLYEYPIILTDLDGYTTHICPIPTLLYWKVTSGLYYKLCKIKGFDNAFGDAYEDYVGRVLNSTLLETSCAIFAGELDNGRSPNRIDWVIDQPKDVLFIECKVKRLSLGAKISANYDEMFKQLELLADAVKQAYMSYIAYRDNEYSNPVYTYDKNKAPYIVVATLEKWYLMGQQAEMLHEIVKEKLVNTGLNEDIFDEAPYVIMNVDDIEEVSYLMKNMRISAILSQYVQEDRAKIGAEFSVYLRRHFKDELKDYKYIFSDNHVDLFTIPSIR